MVRVGIISVFIFINLIVQSCNTHNPLTPFNAIDLHIKGGKIYDGSENPPYIGHIYIVDNNIVYAGKEEWGHPAINKVIDAQGKCVAPGFIDLHAHGNPLSTPSFHNFLAMGVTTIVLGQDGSSPRVNPLKEWMQKVDTSGIGVNLAMMVGHGTLRNLSGIGNNPQPDQEELNIMKEMLDHHLEYCFGLSTGLEYTPGLYAGSEELEDLARIVGKHDRIIMSHMRNEDDDQLEASIEELIDQGAYCKVHVAHIKSVYGKGSERAEEILKLLYDARERGVEITADMYPYNASYTGISILFPEWAKSQEQLKKVLPSRRTELETFIRNKVTLRNGPEATLLGSAPYTGKTLADLEKEMDLPFEKILIDIIGPGGSSGAYFVMDEELQSRLLQDPLISVCSDGSPTGHHPRGHGTFAKVIEKYVMKEKKLTLTEAIHKMTAYAASILGIEDRGLIQSGKKADLIIFSPGAVKAVADYPHPHQLALGFDDIIVNGKVARENGKFSQALNGKMLYPQ